MSTTDTAEDVALALGAAPTPTPSETQAAADAVAEPVADPAVDPAAPDAEAPPANETAEQKTERHSLSAREKRHAKIQQQTDDLVAKRHEARRALEAEEALLADRRRQREAETPAPAPAKPAAAPPAPTVVVPDRPKPQLADLNADGTPKFANYEEWLDDFNTWHADLGEKRAEAKAQTIIQAADARRQTEDRQRDEQAQHQSAQQRVFAQHQTNLDSFKAATPDFDTVLAAAKEHVQDLVDELGPGALNVIDRYTVEDADHGPAIMHYLAQNPDEMDRIAHLTVPRQIAALGRLDARFDSPDPPTTAATPPTARPAVPARSKAPAPIRPVGGGSAGSVPVDPETANYQEYKALRNRQERIARGLPV